MDRDDAPSSPLSILSHSPSPPHGLKTRQTRSAVKRASPANGLDVELTADRKRPRRQSGASTEASVKVSRSPAQKLTPGVSRRRTRRSGATAADLPQAERTAFMSGVVEPNTATDDSDERGAAKDVLNALDSTELASNTPSRTSGRRRKVSEVHEVIVPPTEADLIAQKQSIPTTGNCLSRKSSIAALSASTAESANGEGICDAASNVTLSNRPSRRRKKPIRYKEREEKDIENKLATHLPEVPVSSSAGKKRQPLRGNWSADYLTQNPKSKLTQVNLHALLSHEKAWSSLTRSQQLQLIALLPVKASLPNWPDDMEVPNLPKEHLKTKAVMQSDLASYQDELAAGRYDPIWLEQAADAMEKRADGKFDNWKEKNREEFWGQKQRVDWNATAGDSAAHSLADLVRAGCFEVGDMWRINRGWGRGVDAIMVVKEATITELSGEALAFSFPPLQHISSASANGEDVLVADVTGPKKLSDAILREDGRIPETVRGPNSWREFRVFRKNMDLGGLWDVRELHHQRQLKK